MRPRRQHARTRRGRLAPGRTAIYAPKSRLRPEFAKTVCVLGDVRPEPIGTWPRSSAHIG